jgi:hypothetical protein
MNISLSETQAIKQLAQELYSFLPGNAHPYADQNISFAGAAHSLGLGKFWNSGSKTPAIISLMEGTLANERGKFCSLIVCIVQRGMKYRINNPITQEDIVRINDVIKKLSFKIPELHDPAFLKSLPSKKPKEKEPPSPVNTKTISSLRQELIDMTKLTPQQRGFAFEKFLNAFFQAYKLNPRSSFRLIGEQIDGSLEMDGNTYLIEAKWHNNQINNADLLVFHGKVSGKATWSRGILISYSGFTKEGLAAFSKGRPTNLIAVDGQDIFFVLDGTISLQEMISAKTRIAAEEGSIFVPVQELKMR